MATTNQVRGAEVDRNDATTVSTWSRAALREAEPLEDKVVADIGAGSGQVTFAVTPIAKTVFAVEPVTTLRAYICDKAARGGLENVFVMDGLLSAVPLSIRRTHRHVDAASLLRLVDFSVRL